MTLLSPSLISREIGWDQRVELGHLRPNNLYEVELVRLLVGQRANQNAIHHGKDRRVRSDAKGESQDSDRREAGRFAQHAQAKVQILDEVLNPVHASPAAQADNSRQTTQTAVRKKRPRRSLDRRVSPDRAGWLRNESNRKRRPAPKRHRTRRTADLGPLPVSVCCPLWRPARCARRSRACAAWCCMRGPHRCPAQRAEVLQKRTC